MSAIESQKAALYSPNLPWNTFRPEELGSVIMQFVSDHEPFFRRWAEVWYENFQFLFGNQSIRWSRRYGFAVDYDFLRTNSPFGLRANTNIARVIVEALSSYIFGGLPEWETEAADESSIKGKRFSKIIEKILDAYMQRLACEKEFAVAAVNYVMFGQVGCAIDWKRMAGQILEIPRYHKIKAPLYSTYMASNPYTQGLIETPTQINDNLGGPVFEDRWEPVLDKLGRHIVDKIFSGDMGIHMLTPFELRREIGTYGMHKTKYVQRFRLMDYDEFLDEYKGMEGQTERFKHVRPVYSDPTLYSMAIRHFMRMQFTSPPSIDDGFRRSQNIFKSTLFKYKVFVVEHWDKPHPEKWPYGRRVIVANGECTHVSKPDYQTNKLDGWHPFVEAQWLTANPNSIAAGPMNDVIRKNKELNVKDSLVATAVRRNMGSQLLIKIGSGIDPQRLSGEPGMAHECSDIMGARYLHDDMPLPPVLSRLRELDKEDVYETSGAQDALRGQPSTGATSGYQEKQREEREEKRLHPARLHFETFISGIGEKLIAGLKTNVKKLDDSVMGFLTRSAAGEFTPNDVIAFLSTPVDYGVDINVVKSSMAIKSKATHQATLQELAGGALQQRLAQDAKVLDEYLKEFDAEQLRDSSAAHRDRAQRENEVFLDIINLGPQSDGLSKPLVLFEDDDTIHIAEHQDMFVKHFESFRNNEAWLVMYLEHVEHHRIQQQEKAGTQMPGTSLQTSQMMAQAIKTAQPTVQTIFMKNQMDQMQKQQQQQQAAAQPPQKRHGATAQPPAVSGQAQAPQAPTLPPSPGGGGGTINPQAPSGNTPTALTKGGVH